MNRIICLIVPLVLFLTGCSTPPGNATLVRATCYTKFEDKWGDRVAMCPKLRAKQGITVAADTRLFPFGTIIKIKDKTLKSFVGSDTFIVQDVGGAVFSRKASQKTTPIIDVYIHADNKKDSRRRIQQFIDWIPDYLPIEVCGEG